MRLLRGTGKTFSTSGHAWMPFQYNPHLAAQKQRLHRLVRKGLTGPTDKASLRQAADQAAADHPELIRQRKT